MARSLKPKIAESKKIIQHGKKQSAEARKAFDEQMLRAPMTKGEKVKTAATLGGLAAGGAKLESDRRASQRTSALSLPEKS